METFKAILKTIKKEVRRHTHKHTKKRIVWPCRHYFVVIVTPIWENAENFHAVHIIVEILIMPQFLTSYQGWRGERDTHNERARESERGTKLRETLNLSCMRACLSKKIYLAHYYYEASLRSICSNALTRYVAESLSLSLSLLLLPSSPSSPPPFISSWTNIQAWTIQYND